MAKLVYRPFGLLVSVLGGILASFAFKRVWPLVANQPEAPKATDVRFGWRDVLTAAAIQGAVFGVVKALVDRAGAEGFRSLTGRRPA